jgi:DNA processing protein
VRQLTAAEFPKLLREIPDAPQELYVRGTLPKEGLRYLAVVGSRKITQYGKTVVEHLISGLSGYPICIVSGLALGVDTYTHKAALDAQLTTIAVPGSGLNDSVLYPKSNFQLAQHILESGGALLSEYRPDFAATEWSFPRRNRIMAGMCHATLLIEAGEKSGTLITARLTVDYNRELLVVPANIFSENSRGVHQFLKLGATPITEAEDILDVLHIEKAVRENTRTQYEFNSLEGSILALLSEPQTIELLAQNSQTSVAVVSAALSLLEIEGRICIRSGLVYKK